MRIAIALTLVMIVAPAMADDKTCLSWNQPVTLEGYVVDGIFPGPPDYESVGGGDARYSAQLLYLTEPVCVSGPDPMDAAPIAATELIQLACSETQVTAAMRGERVTLKGKLFSQHTGYHRTAALLECSG